MKITIYEAEQAVTLKIEGRAAKALIAEFDRAWQGLAPSLGSRKLSIDLREVTFMDKLGRNLLAEIHNQTGAEILADRPLTKYYAEEAGRGNRTNL